MWLWNRFLWRKTSRLAIEWRSPIILSHPSRVFLVKRYLRGQSALRKNSNDIFCIYSPVQSAVTHEKPGSNSFIVGETVQRFFYHNFAIDTYYGWTTGRFDAVIMNASDAKVVSECKNGEFTLFLVKLSTFVKVNGACVEEKDCRFLKKTGSTAHDISLFMRWPISIGVKYLRSGR